MGVYQYVLRRGKKTVRVAKMGDKSVRFGTWIYGFKHWYNDEYNNTDWSRHIAPRVRWWNNHESEIPEFAVEAHVDGKGKEHLYPFCGVYRVKNSYGCNVLTYADTSFPSGDHFVGELRILGKKEFEIVEMSFEEYCQRVREREAQARAEREAAKIAANS